MKKNTASQAIGVQMVSSSDGSAFTGAVSVNVTIDNGIQSAGVGTAPAHEGNGYHSYTPTQAETNGDHLAFTFTGTGAIPATVQMHTSFPQSVDNATAIADIPTTAEFEARTLLAADYFDPAADTVANVTTVATATNLTNLPSVPAGWLTAAGIAASALNDKGNWNIGKTGYSISGTKTTLDALNDIAATDIVSAGAITTLAGAVANVDLVDVTTTNSDMRGTDGANTTAPDNASISLILADTDELQLNQGNWLTATGFSTAANQTAMQTDIDAILIDTNDLQTNQGNWLTATGFNTTTPPTVAQIADGVWDELQADHTTAGTFGLYLDSEVSGAGGGSAPTVGEIADGVWDEILSGHAIVGSTGAALSAAGGSGDPWATVLPASYGAGTAGKIIGDNIDALVSSRMAESSINTTAGAIDLVTSISNQVSADVTAISGDSTAADNLEAMYDGTGYTDDTGPASRSQVASIGASSGSAINYAADGDNTGGALKGVTFVGTQTNTFTDTRTVNGIKHEVAGVGNVIDIVYQFNIGSISIPVEVELVGLVNGANDTCEIFVYSYDLATFEQVGEIIGQSGQENKIENIKLLPDHVSDGTTDTIGDVFVRITTAAGATTPTLKTDALFLSAVAKTGALGFEEASVWIDTVNGTAGTASGIGTASRPSSNITDARTIADQSANNLKVFHPIAGSNFTLDQSFDGYSFRQAERGYRCDLSGQSVSNVYFLRANIFGNDSGANAVGTIYESCKMNTNTLGDHATLDCVYGGTTTVAQDNTTYSIARPRVDEVDRAVTININSMLNVGVTLIGMDNDFTFLNSVATTEINISGNGAVITIDATCTGGTLSIFGNFEIIDNSGGAVTINQDARVTNISVREEIDSNSVQLSAILTDTDDLQLNQGNWLTATGFNTIAPDNASITAILADTNELQSDWVDGGRLDLALDGKLDTVGYTAPDNAGIAANNAAIAALNDLSIGDVLNTQITESYAADGVAPTIAQALSIIQQNLGDFSINGTVVTVRQLDGTTAAATYTLDDAVSPTSKTRAT